MFTRLLVGLDGSPQADVALEQAVELGRRFQATIVVVHVRETGSGKREASAPPLPDGAALLERARERIAAVPLAVESVERHGDPDLVLGELARDADAVLIGRRGVTTQRETLGSTAAAVVRSAERCVIVCAGVPSPMRACAVAFDGRATSLRALELAGRFASVVGSTVHIIHASAERAEGLRVVGVAEATLSLQGVPFVTHVEPGVPGAVVADIVTRTRCDSLFAGAHIQRQSGARPSPVVVSHAEQILLHTDIPVCIQP
jgi:nucleotide-binding universal stress UspA family protein